MKIIKDIKEKNKSICVVGLGYVGLPIATAFSKKVNVIGFDIDKKKIETYKLGIDPTNEVGNEEIKNSKIKFTYDEKMINSSVFFIVAVPTPINQDKTPNLSPVENASKIVGRNLTKGAYVVFESTVFPGVTEDVCIPILEKESGLKNGLDFKVGYSPERINPGDKINRLENIKKIVSAQDKESLDQIAEVYKIIIKAGVFKASSIRVAEAAKVVENSQRDINIAFMNELAMVFNRMNIDTAEVIKAMKTKWNALNFTPGLVGGHCIGVDPYYFLYEAERLGYHSQIVISGRKINDGMGKFIVQNILKKMIESDIIVQKAKVSIFGITFKENCPDIRNSKVYDIIEELRNFNIEPSVYDPYASEKDVYNQYNIKLSKLENLKDSDVLVFAVPHNDFRLISHEFISSLYKDHKNKILIDVKSMFSLEELILNNYTYWRL